MLLRPCRPAVLLTSGVCVLESCRGYTVARRLLSLLENRERNRNVIHSAPYPYRARRRRKAKQAGKKGKKKRR